VWITRTPFMVRHLWILNWLDSMKTRTGSDTTKSLLLGAKTIYY
jgi:hypothetical protein